MKVFYEKYKDEDKFVHLGAQKLPGEHNNDEILQPVAKLHGNKI